MKMNPLCAITLVGLSIISLQVEAKTDPKAVAIVNGKTITMRDLELSLSALNESQRASVLQDPNNRRQILEDTIGQVILAQEGMKKNLDKTPEYEEWMEFSKRQWLLSQFIEKEINPKLNDRSLVKKYYNDHIDLFSTDQVRVQHILVKTEAEAVDVLKKVKQPGADFQVIAKEKSIDPSAQDNRGELGFITRDRMVPEFTRAAFSGGTGQIVGPVLTAFGYHIIKVVDKKAGKPQGFDEVELTVRNLFRQELVRNFVNQAKPQAKIQIL